MDVSELCDHPRAASEAPGLLATKVDHKLGTLGSVSISGLRFEETEMPSISMTDTDMTMSIKSRCISRI